MPTAMTIRLDEGTKAKLDQLADATHRSRSFLAGEAIRGYIELNEWQIGEVRQALKEAGRGEFATDAEVKSFFENWQGPLSRPGK